MEVGTQTDWETQEEQSQEEGKEAVPPLAPVRNGTVVTGMQRSARVSTPSTRALHVSDTKRAIAHTGGAGAVSGPRASVTQLYETGVSLPKDPEMLFFTFLMLVAEARGNMSCERWASSVLIEDSRYSELGDKYVMPESKEWKSNGSIFEPMNNAFNGTWYANDLEQIGKAMQAWRGPGRVNGLDVDRLKKYRRLDLRAPSGNSKKPKEGPPRWRTAAAVINVARLIKRFRAELERLLKIEEPLEAVPTIEESYASALALCAQLDSQLKGVQAEKGRVADAHRKAKERLATKAEERRAAVKKARAEEREKKKDAITKRAADYRERLKRDRQAAHEAARAAAEEAVADKLARARARARTVESSAKLSGKRLKRAQRAEAKLDAVMHELDALMEQAEAPKSPTAEEPPAKAARRDARGRWLAMPRKLRVLIWAELSRRVAPSAVAANIYDVLQAYAPEDDALLPCEKEIRKMRGELTVASEAIAAFRVALSKRIRSFGWDESTKFGLGLLSSNTQIETQGGEVVDVVMRGATLTAGGTAEAIAWSIDRKIFSHARQLLLGWKAEHEKQFGIGSWATAGGPEPEAIGIHRLSEQTLLMSDTCNGARACKRLVAEMAMKSGKEKMGDEAWDALTEAQRDAKCKVYIGQCQQHLRNIIINAMQQRATESLKETLAASLDDFSRFDRMSVDVNDLIRAVYKELHGGGAYAKGKGREFTAWVKKHFPSAPFMPFERADGSRQDIAFDGAAPIFFNRKIILEFLRGMMVPGADNQLEKFLLRVLGCNEMTAMLRVNTLWMYIFSQPMRYLCGKSRKLKEWSIDTSSRVLDMVEAAMVEVAADGRKLFDPNFDPFAAIAVEQLLFREWHQKLVQPPSDGSEPSVHQQALSEARSPESAGNEQATETTVQLAEQMANAALVAMRDPKRAICALLTSQDGACAAGKDASAHEATIGANVTNDRVESNFGCMDMLMRMYRYTTVENLSGVSQQMVNQDFWRLLPVDSDRGRKRKETGDEEAQRGGFYHSGLTPELQQSLVDYVRHAAEGARRDGRVALQEQEAEKLSRREERVITLLNKAVEHYAYAKECFEAWQMQRAKTKEQVAAALLDGNGKAKPEAQQLEYLRYQIEMRVLGCGWTQYATRWSSKADSRIGTVAHLQTLLEEILLEEKARGRFTAGTDRGLPTEAAPPQHEARDLGQLGTADADAMEISKRALFSAAELEAKAQAAMGQREATGVACRVERMQPDDAPAFDQDLVGKRIEVLWKYFASDTKEQHMIWSSGTVKRIADGLTDKRSSRAQKILPAGAVLWAWDADPDFDEQAGEQWLILLPQKFNPKKHKQVYSWRLDPRELGAAQGSAPDARRKCARRDCADQE